MRSEHPSTGDEWDLGAYFWDERRQCWVPVYVAHGRPGYRKWIKRRSHRLDRMVKRRIISDEMGDS